MQIQPNPTVPVFVDNVTGQVTITPDTFLPNFGASGAQGLAVVLETASSGNMYLVPAGKTFNGIAVIIAGVGVGNILLQDASNTLLAQSSGSTAGVPAFAAINGLAGEIGGGGGEQLKVTLTAAAQIISVTIAGYLH